MEAQPAVEVIGDDTCASLFERGDVSGRLVTAKTRDYLRWRYRHNSYHALRIDSGGTISGAAIFRCRRHGSFWVSHVCDLFAEDGDRRTVGRLLRQVAAAAPCDLIRCSFASRAQAASHGFIRHRRGTVLMVHQLMPGLVPDPTLSASWSMSVGDLELL